MSFLELLSESSGAFQGRGAIPSRRPWIVLAYLLSVVLACVLISFLTMSGGSMLTTVVVIGLTLMPTVVLFGILRMLHHESAQPPVAAYAPEEPEDSGEEWQPEDDSVEVDSTRPDDIEPEYRQRSPGDSALQDHLA